MPSRSRASEVSRLSLKGLDSPAREKVVPLTRAENLGCTYTSRNSSRFEMKGMERSIRSAVWLVFATSSRNRTEPFFTTMLPTENRRCFFCSSSAAGRFFSRRSEKLYRFASMRVRATLGLVRVTSRTTGPPLKIDLAWASRESSSKETKVPALPFSRTVKPLTPTRSAKGLMVSSPMVTFRLRARESFSSSTGRSQAGRMKKPATA